MHNALFTLENEFSSALQGLTDRDMQLRLHPQDWSIQQITRHLLLSYSFTTGSLQQRIAKSTPTQSRPTLQQTAARFIVVTCGLMPGRRKAPAEVAPADVEDLLSGAALTSQVADSLSGMERALVEAENLFGTRRFLTHFALGPLSAPEWRRFHLCHGRHHIRQIAAIRKAHRL